MSLPKLYTEKEAANALGVSIGTLRNERKAGKIAVTWMRSIPKYKEASLNEYLDRNTRCQDQSRPSGSQDSTCSVGTVVPIGTSHGQISAQDRPDARVLAQAILNKPR